MITEYQHQCIQNELCKIGYIVRKGKITTPNGKVDHPLMVQPKDSSTSTTSSDRLLLRKK